MNKFSLTAEQREILMQAYLRIQVDQDQDVLTVTYAARMSTMPDDELVERLRAYRRDDCNRIAAKALLQAQGLNRPVSTQASVVVPSSSLPNDTTTFDVDAVLTVSFTLENGVIPDTLVSEMNAQLNSLASSGVLFSGMPSAPQVKRYRVKSY